MKKSDGATPNEPPVDPGTAAPTSSAEEAPGGRARLAGPVPLAVAGVLVAALLFAAGWLAHGALGEASSRPDGAAVTAALLPEEGVVLPVSWAGLPALLLEAGVIDADKLQAAVGSEVLAASREDVFAPGGESLVRIDAANASLVLDVLWALGLANRNPIVLQGRLMLRPESYASTAGWTLGEQPGPRYLASMDLIELTPEQQLIVERVALNSYRPCCQNMTAFPDCNHGMAALALVELMAAQGASADEIFAALKRVSPFWFPQQYHHIALDLAFEGESWDDLDPRRLMGEEFSSARGWARVQSRLERRGVFAGSTGGGVSCTA